MELLHAIINTNHRAVRDGPLADVVRHALRNGIGGQSRTMWYLSTIPAASQRFRTPFFNEPAYAVNKTPEAPLRNEGDTPRQVRLEPCNDIRIVSV
jgi:hypothetical protein